jgi:hypothetical protein
VLAQLRLALLADCGCERTLSALSLGARQAGLTGAEIDAAIAGKSFEARTDAALAFACAIKLGDRERIARAHERALRFGVSEADLDIVRTEVVAILARRDL